MDNYGNKFKIGDRVLLRSDSEWWTKDNTDVTNPQNIEGTVDWVDKAGAPMLTVQWDNEKHNSYDNEDLELVGEYSPSYQIY
jgi:hypothetical protein